MADLLTVYDDDQATSLIDCTICNKKIVGETLFKVHLTTVQHLKKEEAEAAKGLIPWPRPLPEWTDIKQYLEYLEPDEPIIGLGALVQEEDEITENGIVQLRYRCKMCSVETDMMTMISHIVSCKHRRRYLELKRPDLVSWKGNTQKQPGLVARAKAALVEKQEGWGTPIVLNQTRKKMKVNNQGHSTAERSRGYSHEKSYSQEKSYSHEKSYTGRDGRGRSSLAEQSSRSSHLEDNARERSLRSHDSDLYNRSSRDSSTHQRSYSVDAREKTYSSDGRQRSNQSGDRDERHYWEKNARSFLEDQTSRKHHADPDTAGRSYHDEQQDVRYSDISPSGEWNSGRDTQDDLYPRNRYADTQLSSTVLHSEKVDYQHGRQLQDQMYTSQEERAHGRDMLPWQGSRFQYAEMERNDVHVERTAQALPYMMQGYPQKHSDGLSDYTQEHGSAKRKRKSRFSDATPLEVALTQKSLIESAVQKKNPNTRAISTKSGDWDSDVPRTSLNPDNVLDVLNDIRIENVEEAHFLKEKLCNVLKEFHASKAQHSEQKKQVSPYVRGYSDRSDEWMNQDREERPLDEQGFQGTTRYEHDPRHFQEARRTSNNPASIQEAWRFGDTSKTQDFQNARSFDDGHKDIRGYEKDSYQDSARYENQTKGFQDLRCFEDDSRSSMYEDNSRGFQLSRHFNDPSRFQQAFEDSPSAKGYDEYERKKEVEGRYWEDDLRRPQSSVNTQPEFKWDPKRGAPADRSEDLYHPDDRSYSERHWNSKYLREEERAYGESETQRPYETDYSSGAEPYDPFKPSSPPRDVAHTSSLEKIASTLLELVARK